MENTAKKIAEMLLEIKAIKIRPETPFTWASGWKSPIYCDNRLSLSYPDVRTYVKEALAKLIKEEFPEVEVIAGVATAGIPQGALVAEELGLPFCYVRSKPKGHGMTNMIEGEVREGAKAVVIEDLISTGGSSIKAAKDLQAAGVEVLGLVSIFTYGFPIADNNFKEAAIEYRTLSNYPTLLEVALEKDYIDASKLETLKEWRENPSVWG
ncbi:orotate phosphoribosyltransferase [Sediminitomix flava]|nr:orotate phosphoribosyltransferase [Sediminitomix flava]